VCIYIAGIRRATPSRPTNNCKSEREAFISVHFNELKKENKATDFSLNFIKRNKKLFLLLLLICNYKIINFAMAIW